MCTLVRVSALSQKYHTYYEKTLKLAGLKKTFPSLLVLHLLRHSVLLLTYVRKWESQVKQRAK